MEDVLQSGHNAGQTRDIIAQALTKATRQDKVALHVNDHERRVRQLKGKGIGLSGEFGHGGGGEQGSWATGQWTGVERSGHQWTSMHSIGEHGIG